MRARPVNPTLDMVFSLRFYRQAGFLLVFLAPFFLLSAQSVTTFREAAEAALSAYEVPGFAVGIIKDGEVVMAEGFGTRTNGKE